MTEITSSGKLPHASKNKGKGARGSREGANFRGSRQGGSNSKHKGEKLRSQGRNGVERRHSAEGSLNHEAPATLVRPVFFIGFMGAGKTSVSRYIARRWKLSAIDLDVYLERREGRAIREIFADDGEDVFRAIETDVLREVGESSHPSLVSCGGGVVERPENRDLLRELGTVVYLRVSADEAAERISNKKSRPLFNDIESARALCNRRGPLYDEVADVIVDTAGKSVAAIAFEVMEALRHGSDVWLDAVNGSR